MKMQPRQYDIVITQEDELTKQQYTQPIEAFEIVSDCSAVRQVLEAFPATEAETVFMTYTRS